MTVNAPPFAPVLRIYPGAPPADVESWGAGVDISSYIRHPGMDGGQPITYSFGRPDEAASVDPSNLKLTLDNRGGEFSIRNPNGPWYGSLRRGTPIVLAMPSGADLFDRVVASGLGTSSGGGVWGTATNWSTSGTYAQYAAATANVASNPILGGADANDLSARVTVWPTVAATGAPLVYGFALRRTDNSNYLYATIEFDAAGVIGVRLRKIISGGMSDITSGVTLGATYVANDKWRILAQTDGPSVRIKVWKPADPADPDADEPDDWTMTGTETTQTGTDVGLAVWRLAGNTNPGTVNFRFSDLIITVPEFTGQVVQWPVRWDMSGNNCWAPIEASGILRRLQQGAGVLKSPLTRQLSSYAPTGYWPLEDGSDAASFGALTTGTRAAQKIGSVSAAADSTLPGAATGPVFSSSGASIRFYTPNRQTGTGFSVMFLMKLSALPASKTKVASFQGAGRITTWNLYIDNSSNIYTEGLEPDGTVTINVSSPIVTNPLNWNAYQLEAATSAGVVWAMSWHEVGETSYYAHTDSFGSGAQHRVYGGTLGGGSSDLSGAAFGHIWVGENTLPFVTDTFSLVSDGYRGELASARIARLAADEGIALLVEDGDSEPLGPQRVATFLATVQASADADYGILYERGSGLGYRPRSARYNRPVAMELAVAAGEIAEPPEPIDDDQRVRNDWTVSRDDGSSARVFDQTHIDAEGRYADSVTINVERDDVLPDHAGWRLYLGTRPELRWPGMVLNMARTPDLIQAWRVRPFAPRIQVTTGLDQVSTAEPDVIAEGASVVLTPTEWRATMNCSAAKPWDQAVLDDDLRLDTAGSSLATDEDTTSTTWSVATTSGPIWVTTALHPAEFPFVIECEGEWVTVTAITGTSSPQTFTVTRSTNGVVKAHATGAEISLAVPTYLAL